MKILKGIIVFFLITSCSKDKDTPSNEPVPTIIGKWEWVKQETREGGATSTETKTPLQNCKLDYINFKADNQIYRIIHSFPCVENVTTYTYVLTNTTVDYDNSLRTIEKLTATELVLTQPVATNITAYFYKRVQ
jgi:hypothetical protein